MTWHRVCHPYYYQSFAVCYAFSKACNTETFMLLFKGNAGPVRLMAPQSSAPLGQMMVLCIPLGRASLVKSCN